VGRYKTGFTSLTYLQISYERDNMITEKRKEIVTEVKNKQKVKYLQPSNLVLKKLKQINSTDGASFSSRY